MLAFAAAALLLTTGAASYAGNILENPGFETGGIEPWEHYKFIEFPGDPDPEELWIATTENPHSGQYCARGLGCRLIFQQIFEPMEVDSITEFSCWLRQDQNLDLSINMVFDDPTDDEPGVGLLFDRYLESTDWWFYDGLTELHWAAEMAEEALGNGCRLVAVGINGTFETYTYVDDWVVAPEPTSLTLLSLAALFVLRRRPV
jgi:hypothetical protein